jgi:hypothetical protein
VTFGCPENQTIGNNLPFLGNSAAGCKAVARETFAIVSFKDGKKYLLLLCYTNRCWQVLLNFHIGNGIDVLKISQMVVE